MDMSVRALEEAIPIRRQIDSLEKRLSLSLSVSVCVCVCYSDRFACKPVQPPERQSAFQRDAQMGAIV